MAFAKITQVAHYTPSQIITNQDLARHMDTSDAWITSRTGIRQRHISEGEDTSDLATAVAQKLLDKSQVSPEELDFILVATLTPDTQMPSVAAKVQGRIKATSAFAFDLSAACSGFIFALSMAEKLIASGCYQKGLVIGAEVMSKILDWTDRRTAVLFGDGAGGVLLETAPQSHFLAGSLHSDGSQYQHLQSGGSNFHTPFVSKKTSPAHLSMDGRAVFDFTVKTVAKSIKQLVDNNAHLSLDYCLLHQANSRILDIMAKKIGLERRYFLANIADYGNTSAASIPLLLSESVEKGIINLGTGQTLLLSAFGGGLTWGSLIVKL